MSNSFNTLSLLSLKCAANIFDLSSALSHVSIRDQIVRAQLLIRDIAASKVPHEEILIIGAGVAGVTAAVEAARKGIKVTVLDVNSMPFGLQAKANDRYIGPYMYEWPAIFHQPQDFPPKDWPKGRVPTQSFENIVSWLSDQPINGRDFAVNQTSRLKQVLNDWSGSSKPTFLMNVNPASIKEAILKFRSKETARFDIAGHDWSSTPTPAGASIGSGVVVSVEPRFIILAAGMGPENTFLEAKAENSVIAKVEGPKFWNPDDLQSSPLNRRIGIFGGGDGALQDFLRAVSVFKHPLDYIDHIRSNGEVAHLMDNEYAYLLSIEQQSRLAGTWTEDNQYLQSLDRQCKEVASRLSEDCRVRRMVASGLRERPEDGVNESGGIIDFVYLYTRESFFGKAYLLNRFLVHLLERCRFWSSGEFRSKREFQVHMETEGKPQRSSEIGQPALLKIQKVNSSGSDREVEFDVVIVRFGIEKGQIPGQQMVGISNKKKATRTTLSRIPLPFYVEGN